MPNEFMKKYKDFEKELIEEGRKSESPDLPVYLVGKCQKIPYFGLNRAYDIFAKAYYEAHPQEKSNNKK